MSEKQKLLTTCLIFSLFLVATTTALQSHTPLTSIHSEAWGQELEPTPMMGRFAVPEMPENPTQVDIGENLYFYHCMPCHGDSGQGLTDEFREAWVDDHQNCWARGCHTGRPEDEGFPIPKIVPPVVASQLIGHFPTAQKLYDYLSIEHPPQNPGVLEADEYWALTAFLWFKNGQLPQEVELAPAMDAPITSEIDAQPGSEIKPETLPHSPPEANPNPQRYFISFGFILFGAILIITLILFIRKRKRSDHSMMARGDLGE